MTDHNHEQIPIRGSEQIRFPGSENDRILDAALAKYAAVEPRAGLEGRILAGIRAAQAGHGKQAGWRTCRWGWAAAVAAMVILAAGFILREHYFQPLGLHLPYVPAPQAPETSNSETHLAKLNPRAAPQPGGQPLHHIRVAPSAQPEAVTAVLPKLDEFPSPRPLSEQEKLLARYVAFDPRHATLVAEARMEQLRQDQEEEQREQSDDVGGTNPRDEKSR
jgi:hypothetical protein